MIARWYLHRRSLEAKNTEVPEKQNTTTSITQVVTNIAHELIEIFQVQQLRKAYDHKRSTHSSLNTITQDRIALLALKNSRLRLAPRPVSCAFCERCNGSEDFFIVDNPSFPSLLCFPSKFTSIHRSCDHEIHRGITRDSISIILILVHRRGKEIRIYMQPIVGNNLHFGNNCIRGSSRGGFEDEVW